MRARLQLVLSVDHDLLVGLEAGIYQRLAVTDLRDLDLADGHGAVGIDDIGVRSFRTLLHDRCRNGQAVVPDIEQQPGVDKLARPEPVRRVGKIRLELDRAGGLQDLVVDEAELPFIQLHRVILVVGENLQRRLGLLLLLLNLRQTRIGKRKYQRNWMELRHDDEAVGIRRADDVADVDLTNTYHAIDRGRQARVAELDLRGVNQGLIGLDSRPQLPHLRLLGLDQLWRGPTLVSQLGVAFEIGLGIDELGLVALQVSGVLVDQGLIGTRIDLREQIAGMHGLAFGEVDAVDLPLDVGAHHVGVVRDHRADTGKIDRHVVLGDRPTDDRRRRLWSGRGSDLLQWANMHEVEQTAGRKHRSQGNRDNDFLFHGRSRSQMEKLFQGIVLAVVDEAVAGVETVGIVGIDGAAPTVGNTLDVGTAG